MNNLDKIAQEKSWFDENYFMTMIEEGRYNKLHEKVQIAMCLAFKAGYREGVRNPKLDEEDYNPIRDY